MAAKWVKYKMYLEGKPIPYGEGYQFLYNNQDLCSLLDYLRADCYEIRHELLESSEVPEEYKIKEKEHQERLIEISAREVAIFRQNLIELKDKNV